MYVKSNQIMESIQTRTDKGKNRGKKGEKKRKRKRFWFCRTAISAEGLSQWENEDRLAAAADAAPSHCTHLIYSYLSLIVLGLEGHNMTRQDKTRRKREKSIPVKQATGYVTNAHCLV